MHFDIEFVISPYVVQLHSVLVLSNKNSISCVVVRKQQMSENLLWPRRHTKQTHETPSYHASDQPALNPFVALTLNFPFVTYICDPGMDYSPCPNICHNNASWAGFGHWKHPSQRGSGPNLNLAQTLICANQNTSRHRPGVSLA